MLKKIINKYGSLTKLSFHYQRSVTDYDKREKISNRIAKKIGKTEFTGESIIPSKDLNNDLSTKGYINFGKLLDNQQVDDILNNINGLEGHDPYKSQLGLFKIKDAPEEARFTYYKREDLVKVPEIISLANDPQILTLVQEFLGAKPTISNISCWWSLPYHDKAEQHQLFHRDADDYKFCKLFFYLTDVGPDSGPHVYVENSADTNTLTKVRRYSDEEISKEFGEKSIKTFTGNKGSSFLVNTYGFHKGLLPKDKKRLILQVEYSLNPLGLETYKPVAKTHSYNNYVNRLLLK